MEARQNELELSGIPVDVADCEDAGNIGLERSRFDRDQFPILHFDAPIRDRPEFHGQSEERQQSVAANIINGSVVALDGRLGELATVTPEPRHLAEPEINLALFCQRY